MPPKYPAAHPIADTRPVRSPEATCPIMAL